jgi:hypothetical protein
VSIKFNPRLTDLCRAFGSPTDGAPTNALTVLVGLARDSDFDATVALLRALADELGHDTETPLHLESSVLADKFEFGFMESVET